MRYKLILLLLALTLIIGAVFTHRSRAVSLDPTHFPSCYDLPDEHYSGPCIGVAIDGVIIGD